MALRIAAKPFLCLYHEFASNSIEAVALRRTTAGGGCKRTQIGKSLLNIFIARLWQRLTKKWKFYRNRTEGSD
jgi:hypothetical protein